LQEGFGRMNARSKYGLRSLKKKKKLNMRYFTKLRKKRFNERINFNHFLQL